MVQQLEVIASGVAFIKLDAGKFPELKRRLGLARFPCVLFSTHGEVQEIAVGDSTEEILAILVKWYKTVYVR